MYCLECGTKIEEGGLLCPSCGLLVSEMKERIAEAQEKVVYSDAVSPEFTEKLPLVADRSYLDAQGNPFDPSKEASIPAAPAAARDLSAIPEIGASDPNITVPMQRIVSSGGEVVADVDTNPKAFIQERPAQSFSALKIVVLAVLVCALVALIYFAYVSGYFTAT